MSLNQRIKQGFLRLPALDKALLFGSLLLTVSPLMPWFDNRNSSGVGESYLGVEGPLFVVGILVGVLGAVSFLQMFLPLMGKNFFKNRKHGGIALIMGFQALLLIGVANSVFFHPEFGSNVTAKTTRFGLIFAFVSVGILIVGGYLANRRAPKEVEEPEEEEAEYSSPISTPSYSSPMPTYTPPAPAAPSSSVSPLFNNSTPSGVDPLTLDARTRYRMMNSSARTNLWQRQRSEERDDG
ncbi:MAG: hypothetical protein AAB802_04380 [Patescibacteria group bacterium]